MNNFLTTGGFADTDAPTPANVVAAASASFDGSLTADLQNSSNTSLQKDFGDTVIVGAWIKPTSQTDALVVGSFTSSTESWALLAEANDVYFHARTTPVSSANITSTQTLSNGTKYFVVAWFNPADAKSRIRVNGGSIDTGTASTESAYTNDAGIFEIGGDTFEEFGQSFHGLIDEVFICKNPANLATALTTINTSIYNSGTGARYGALSNADKTTIGLVGWWGLDESSGTRRDLHGTVDLTPTGAVTQGTALVS